MGTYDVFKTDPELEKKGVWLDLGDAGKYLLARAGGSNKAFQKRFESLTKPYRRAIQTETMDNDVADKILVKIYTDCVILGWENVTGRDGEQLEFNRDNCIKLLMDLPDLFTAIRDTATSSAVYREVVREEDSKNS